MTGTSALTSAARNPASPWLLIGLFLTVVYAVIFMTTGSSSWTGATIAAISNAASLIFLSFVALRLSHYAPSGLSWAAAWHSLFSTGFVVCWMGGITLIDTALNWAISGTWSFWWFGGPALTWQLLQGYVIYALVAVSASYLRLAELHRCAPPAADSERRAPAVPKIFLVQQDEGLVPVDPKSILAVEATGDYVRLVRAHRSLLVKMTMLDAERRLSDQGFLRVHRSWLVRLESISMFEPVGQGRWRALLPGGAEVPVSRSGAKALKQLLF